MSKYEDPKKKRKGTYLITGWEARIFFMWGKRKKREPAVGTFLLLFSEIQMLLGIYQLL